MVLPLLCAQLSPVPGLSRELRKNWMDRWTDGHLHTSEQMVASWVMGADARAVASARLKEAEQKGEHPQLTWHSGPPGALPGPSFKSHLFPSWVAQSSLTSLPAGRATLYCLVPHLPHPNLVSLPTSCLPCKALFVSPFILTLSCGRPLERRLHPLSI